MTGANSITVHIKGKDRQLPSGLSVFALLEHLELNPALVVVELNREILDRGHYVDAQVEGGDVLELVHFVGGG